MKQIVSLVGRNFFKLFIGIQENMMKSSVNLIINKLLEFSNILYKNFYNTNNNYIYYYHYFENFIKILVFSVEIFTDYIVKVYSKNSVS